MNYSILVVSNNKDLIALFHQTHQDFEITSMETAEDGLKALSVSDHYSVFCVDSNLVDVANTSFFKQAAASSPAIPVLITEEQQLALFLTRANQLSLFRLLQFPCSLKDLEKILSDAVNQFTLVQCKRELGGKQQYSLTDPLTGSLSRHAIEKRLPIELHRSIRYGHYLSILLCDVDDMKKINATHGHRIGDRILTEFAQAAGATLRQEIDWICRWGDDEFLIVLPETPVHGAGRLANRLRETITALTINTDGNHIRFSVCIGVSGYAPEDPERKNTMQKLLLVAESCLQQAKEGDGHKILICP